MTGDAATVRVGLLGCGTVGASLVRLLADEADEIAARTGLRFEVAAVAVRDPGRDRGLPLPADVFTADAGRVVGAADVDVVVEVMGGTDPTRALVETALAAGKPVVTANKELLAACGPALFAVADAAGVDLLFEAAVGGGIPIVRPMRESLLGEPLRRILGILNGTTNFILTKMTEDGADFGDVLADAQRRGYAEADPAADVEGHDAAAKIAILASIGFGARVTAADVAVEGISGITADDIAFARRRDLVVKLLGIAERVGAGGHPEVAVRVHPVLLPATHPLASVRESFNAVFVEGASVGELMFYGRGAGGQPTASAVLGDLIDAGANRRRGFHASMGAFGDVAIAAVDDLVTEYYIALDVVDRPGVLAAVAAVFGAHQVSIASMEQEMLAAGARPDGSARLVFITHRAVERDVRSTLDDLRRLDVVEGVGSVIPLLTGAAP